MRRYQLLLCASLLTLWHSAYISHLSNALVADIIMTLRMKSFRPTALNALNLPSYRSLYNLLFLIPTSPEYLDSFSTTINKQNSIYIPITSILRVCFPRPRRDYVRGVCVCVCVCFIWKSRRGSM